MITLSANKEFHFFHFNLGTWIHFFSFLIALAWSYNTTLNRSDENGHYGLVTDFRWSTFIHSPLSKMLPVGFS